jgi:hypothetical protein
MKTTIFGLAMAATATAFAQAPGDEAALLAAQREAMAPLAAMDGIWRGEAWTVQPGGGKSVVTQTERIGPFLGGTVKMIEGRGYREDGSVGFNAFGIVSYDAAKRAYTLRSYAHGRNGDFAFRPRPGGYEWEIPTPGALIRYSATIADGVLHEVGDRIVAGQPPMRFFEMKLRRLGDTDWPVAQPVPPR